MSSIIGKKSTYKVKCAVCDQTFGDAGGHNCPFEGVELANMLREMRASIRSLESEVRDLRMQIRDMANGVDGAGLQ